MRFMTKKYRLVSLFVGATALVLVLMARLHEVKSSLTERDIMYLQKLNQEFSLSPLDENTSYEDEIDLIQKIQKATLKLTPRWEGIPFGMTREPEDVYQRAQGLCYDRSRLIEKWAKFNRFPVRHVGLYSTINHPALIALILDETNSHSITEVRTKKGWMVVDSNDPWLSLDRNGYPISLSQIKKNTKGPTLDWHPNYVSHMNHVYEQPFTYVYGLYSRHGRFYPPYNFIPDINWKEFLLTFVCS